MMKHGQMVPMISFSLGYHSSIFHHQWLYDAKNPFVCLASSISHVKNRRSTFLCFSSYGTHFPCFWIIPNDFKRYEIVCWVTSNVRASSFCVWHESSSNNTSNSASSYTFGLPLRSLSSTSNLPFLNFWNHSRQLLSLKAASPCFYKQSMSLSCKFLQIKEVNQKFPQMTFIRLKTRHFCTKKNIWCWYKIANISRLRCCRRSNLMICRFTSNNFNYNLLVAPSFANGGNLFVLPIFWQYSYSHKRLFRWWRFNLISLLCNGSETIVPY